MEHTIKDPDGEGRLRVTFAGFATDKPETIDDPTVVGGTRRVDRVWVQIQEGEREGDALLVRRSEVRPPFG